MNCSSRIQSVTEIQGLYGPLRILESRVQEIWATQQLQRGIWKTRSGERIRVRHPGSWNRGKGPDFRGAIVEIDGRVRAGDVEIHLHREDWWRHGHDRDPGYRHVVLHAVLFAGGMDREIRTTSGSVPSEWIIGPWLREDIESVSGGEPGLFGEMVPELREWVESAPPPVLREQLRVGADQRWGSKEGMARLILENNGWEAGLYRISLYCLGYPFNRRVFLDIAERLPMEAWRNPGTLERIREHYGKAIQWGSGRPANRAENRLQQFRELVRRVPDWPRRLRRIPVRLCERLDQSTAGQGPAPMTSAFRRQAGLPMWQKWLRNEVTGDTLPEGVVNRLWIDAFLPLLARDGHINPQQAAQLWFHWKPAEFPDSCRTLLPVLEVHARHGRALCNGWIQGMYWMEDQARLERIRRWGGKAGPGASGSGA